MIFFSFKKGKFALDLQIFHAILHVFKLLYVISLRKITLQRNKKKINAQTFFALILLKLHNYLKFVLKCKVKMKNIAIFASGSGSNAENIVNYFRDNQEVSISLIICNKADAFVFERAKRLGIPSRLVTKTQMQDEAAVLSLLHEYRIDFIVLAGYLLLVPKYLVDAYPHAIVNIHPALIPLHCGKGMYGDKVHEDVIKCGDKQSGITIHYVNEFFDNGDIIFQATCPVEPGDDAHAVATKVHALEYAHFPRIIAETIAKL